MHQIDTKSSKRAGIQRESSAEKQQRQSYYDTWFDKYADDYQSGYQSSENDT